jgi:hypothetical protein
MVAALRACAVPLPAARHLFFRHWGLAMLMLLKRHPVNTHKAVAAGVIELLVAHMRARAASSGAVDGGASILFNVACPVLEHLVVGQEARAVLAGALEALEAQNADDLGAIAQVIRLELIDNLQPAARHHDAAPCAVAGCQRCAAARNSGVMCALPGCGARVRDGAAAKKLLRCGTCRAACYCGAAHQRADWRRHKGACIAPPPHNDDEQAAAGASGS